MNIINVKDCVNSRKNTGFGDCVLEFGIPKGYILTPKGWSLDLNTQTFDKTYINEQIQAGEFIPFMGAVEFTDNTPENNKEEFQGGVKSTNRNGLPEFGYKFIRGGWLFNNAVASWDTFAQYDMLMVFEKGIAGVTLADGVLGAFDLGDISTNTYKHFDGNASGHTMVSLQLLSAEQYRNDVAMLDKVALGYGNPVNEILPISDVVFTDGTADASDNKITFKMAFKMNEGEVVQGADIPNFKVYEDGVSKTISVSTFNSLTKKYELTLSVAPVAASKIVVTTYDDVAGVAVAKINNRFFKGESAEITTTA